MKTLFDAEGHLTAEAIGAFYCCALSEDDLDAVAVHLAECPLCAEQLAARAADLHSAPVGLAEQIAARIGEADEEVLDMQAANQRDPLAEKASAAQGAKPGAAASNRTQPRRQAHALFFYSMRVAAAAGIAIAILCSGLFHRPKQQREPQALALPQMLNQTLYHVSNTLSEFTNKMIQTEGNQNEKTKK